MFVKWAAHLGLDAGHSGRQTRYTALINGRSQMTKPPKDILRLPVEERAEIALKVAVAKAIDENVRLGIPIYISRKGKVLKLSRKRLAIPQ